MVDTASEALAVSISEKACVDTVSYTHLAAAHREEREKKKSVMEQLKSQPKAEHKKTAPKKSAEREI